MLFELRQPLIGKRKLNSLQAGPTAAKSEPVYFTRLLLLANPAMDALGLWDKLPGKWLIQSCQCLPLMMVLRLIALSMLAYNAFQHRGHGHYLEKCLRQLRGYADFSEILSRSLRL